MLRGPGIIDASCYPDRPCGEQSTVSRKQWEALCYYEAEIGAKDVVDGTKKTENSMSFSGLSRSITEHYSDWDAWSNKPFPHQERLPDNFDQQVNKFQKLMLVNVFREECTLFALIDFVDRKLGKRFVEFPSVSMEDVYSKTAFYTPVIFILSQGRPI